MLQTLSADGATNGVTTNDKVHVHLSGTFGGGTATLQFKDAAGTWTAITGAAYTAAADDIIQLGSSQYNLRINLASSTSPALKVELRG
jgi:hypothetical protein